MLLSYVCESVRASDGRRPEDPGRQTRSPDLKPPRGATPDLSQGKCVLIGPPPTPPVRESWAFPGDSDGKEFTCCAEDPGSIPGLGRCPGEGNGNPL